MRVDDVEWEDATLYRAMVADSLEVFSIVSPEDFTPPARQELAFILASLKHDGDMRMEAVEQARRSGQTRALTLIVNLMSTATWMAPGAYYAQNVAEASAKRKLDVIATQMLDMTKRLSGDDLWAAITEQTDAIKKIHLGASVDDDDAYDMDYFLSLDHRERPFTIPGLLTKEDRFLMVGKEGGGKSTLVYQIMTGAAYGVNTLHPDLERYEPQRVLFLDVENSEFQISDQIHRVHGVIKEAAEEGVKPQWKSMKRKVVDLADKTQAASVIRSVVNHRPTLFYIGSAYKLAYAEDYRKMFHAISSTIDSIRAEIGCTTIIEHHAGWGDKNDRNGWRPDGSSEWSRWADFSYGMDVRMVRGRRVMKLVQSSRMDRTEGRMWPGGFMQSQTVPWASLDHDEFEIMFGQDFNNNGGSNR